MTIFLLNNQTLYFKKDIIHNKLIRFIYLFWEKDISLNSWIFETNFSNHQLLKMIITIYIYILLK